MPIEPEEMPVASRRCKKWAAGSLRPLPSLPAFMHRPDAASSDDEAEKMIRNA